MNYWILLFMTTKGIKCSKHTIYNFEWSLSYILQIIFFPFALHWEQLIQESQHKTILLVMVSIFSMKLKLHNLRGIYISIRHVCKLCKIGKIKKHRKRIKMQIVFCKGKLVWTNKERNLIGVIPKRILKASGKKLIRN